MKDEKRIIELKKSFKRSLPFMVCSILVIVPSFLFIIYGDMYGQQFCDKLDGWTLKIAIGTAEECANEGYMPLAMYIFGFAGISGFYLLAITLWFGMEFIEAIWFGKEVK